MCQRLTPWPTEQTAPWCSRSPGKDLRVALVMRLTCGQQPARTLGPQFFNHNELNSANSLNELGRGRHASETPSREPSDAVSRAGPARSVRQSMRSFMGWLARQPQKLRWAPRSALGSTDFNPIRVFFFSQEVCQTSPSCLPHPRHPPPQNNQSTFLIRVLKPTAPH